MAYVAQKTESGCITNGKSEYTVISTPVSGGSGGVTKGMYTGSTKGDSKGEGVVKKAASKTGWWKRILQQSFKVKR